MAEKNTTRKNNVKEQAQNITESVSMSKAVAKKKRDPSEPVDCVSITAGELGMTGIKSGINYRWAELGDTTEVEYQDIIAAIRSHTVSYTHLTLPTT